MAGIARGKSEDTERRAPVAVGVFSDLGGETEGLAPGGEGVRLCSRPAVTGETVGAVGDVALDGHEPATRRQDTAELTERGVNVGPSGGRWPATTRRSPSRRRRVVPALSRGRSAVPSPG